MNRKYYRVKLGKTGCYAERCKSDGFVGADILSEENLTSNLCEDWHDFNKRYIPIWLNAHPDSNKIRAGLACGNLWVLCKRGFLKRDNK